MKSRAHIIPAESRQAIADMILRAWAGFDGSLLDVSRATKIRTERLSSLIEKLHRIKVNPTSASPLMPRLEILAAFCEGLGYNMSIIMKKRK